MSKMPKPHILINKTTLSFVIVAHLIDWDTSEMSDRSSMLCRSSCHSVCL